MQTVEYEVVVSQVRHWPLNQQVNLIKEVVEMLARQHRKDMVVEPSQPLVYGKYRNSGRQPSTEEDFRLAEWHPTEQELDGE